MSSVFSEEDFKTYLSNKVVCFVESETEVEAIERELMNSGFEDSSTEVLSGEKGLSMLDPDGEESGFFGKVFRKLQKAVIRQDRLFFEESKENLKNGNYLFVASAEDKDKKEKATKILENNGGTGIRDFGNFTIERLS